MSNPLFCEKWEKVLAPNGAIKVERGLKEGRKRMKEWGKVTFMKECVKALDKMRILAPTDLKNLFSFPRYGRLNKKFRDNFFPNSKYIFLFIELSESYFGGHF